MQVPSEAYRLGRTRVFFRAGQISTLQRILNETTPDKAPWIFGRLQEALANRHKAKAAAEEAQVLPLLPFFSSLLFLRRRKLRLGYKYFCAVIPEF